MLEDNGWGDAVLALQGGGGRGAVFVDALSDAVIVPVFFLDL